MPKFRAFGNTPYHDKGISNICAFVLGILIFVRAIAYNFYSLLTLLFIVLIIAAKADLGPMKLAEINARPGKRPLSYYAAKRI